MQWRHRAQAIASKHRPRCASKHRPSCAYIQPQPPLPEASNEGGLPGRSARRTAVTSLFHRARCLRGTLSPKQSATRIKVMFGFASSNLCRLLAIFFASYLLLRCAKRGSQKPQVASPCAARGCRARPACVVSGMPPPRGGRILWQCAEHERVNFESEREDFESNKRRQHCKTKRHGFWIV